MNRVIVGLGSNIAPLKNIRQALCLLHRKYTILARSAWLWTQPTDVLQPQPVFINTGCMLITQQSLARLTQGLKKIESALKRPAHNRHLPRTIDLDILVWNNHIVDKDVQRRDFLVAIIMEISPQLNLPYPHYAKQIRGVCSQWSAS